MVITVTVHSIDSLTECTVTVIPALYVAWFRIQPSESAAPPSKSPLDRLSTNEPSALALG
jgi:hypothetical protein